MLSEHLKTSLEQSLGAKLILEQGGVMFLESPTSEYVAFHFFNPLNNLVSLYCEPANEQQFLAFSEHPSLHRIATEAYCVADLGKAPDSWLLSIPEIIRLPRGRRVIVKTPTGDPMVMI
jgi:hypothetical protein